MSASEKKTRLKEKRRRRYVRRARARARANWGRLKDGESEGERKRMEKIGKDEPSRERKYFACSARRGEIR